MQARRSARELALLGISQLPATSEKLETQQMMELAETGFTEWNDKEEDIYDV